jgi:hypothetical protein
LSLAFNALDQWTKSQLFAFHALREALLASREALTMFLKSSTSAALPQGALAMLYVTAALRRCPAASSPLRRSSAI